MIKFLPRLVAGASVSWETHDQPHADELVGWWLIVLLATEEWLRQHCPVGLIQIGIGGGEFDEHPVLGQDGRKHGCCAATLIADSLGADQNVFQPLFGYLLRHENGKEGRPGDLGTTIKKINALYPNEPQLALGWAMLFCDGWLHQRLVDLSAKQPPTSDQFFYRRVAEALRTMHASRPGLVDRWLAVADNAWQNADAKLTAAISILDAQDRLTVDDTDQISHQVVAVVSDAAELHTAFFRPACTDAVLVRFESDGHFQIYHRRPLRNLGRAIAEQLRVEILRSQQCSNDAILARTDLGNDGFIDRVPQIYYFRNGDLVLCGTLTNRDVPVPELHQDPTENRRLIVEAVCEAIRLYRIPQSRRSSPNVP